MDDSWARIEREARTVAQSVVAEMEATPLAYGDHIAWVTTAMHAMTDGLSDVHRVGFPQRDEPYTTCGERIPHPRLWFALNAALVRSMAPCRFCAAEYARSLRENAA